MSINSFLKAVFVCLGLLSISIVSQAGSTEQAAVGILKAKKHLVEIYTSRNGPLYTVKNHAGDVLGEHLTDSEVLSQFPDLKSVIQGYADDASLGPNVRKRMNSTDSNY